MGRFRPKITIIRGRPVLRMVSCLSCGFRSNSILVHLPFFFRLHSKPNSIKKTIFSTTSVILVSFPKSILQPAEYNYHKFYIVYIEESILQI